MSESSSSDAVQDPIRKIHVLSAIAKFSSIRLPSVPCSTTSPDAIDVASSSELVLTDYRIVRVTDKLVHSHILGKMLSFISHTLQGRHVRTFPITLSLGVGIAVNAAETLIATSHPKTSEGNRVYLHSLPDGKLLQKIGFDEPKGTYVSRFHDFCSVRFVNNNKNFLVADWLYDEIQEFELDGRHLRSIPSNHPRCMNVSHDGKMLVVGSATFDYVDNGKRLTLVHYASGLMLRVFGDGVKGWVQNVCFTPDDTHVIVGCKQLPSLLVFAVSNGSLVRSICPGVSQRFSCPDIACCDNGEIAVIDGNGQIVVYSSAGDTVRLRIVAKRTQDGQDVGKDGRPPSSPSLYALCIVNERVYAVEYGAPRVQVFE